jgi:hypothetical protein
MNPGLYLDLSEADYHNDPHETPSLSVTTAKALVLESEAHAYLRHPKLGGQPFVPSTEMDRGSLIHFLLLGRGVVRVVIVECDEWTKKKDKEARNEARAAGFLPVTRKLYDASVIAAAEIRKKLDARGYKLDGHSEVSVLWHETASDGTLVPCRARMDHLIGSEIWDLKLGDANPKRFKRGHLTAMGYDIQGAAYPRALESTDVRLRGRVVFKLLFCEPEPPYCITPVRFAGSLRELGARKWARAVDTFSACLRTGHWGDYVDGECVAEARPYELDDEMAGEESAAR